MNTPRHSTPKPKGHTFLSEAGRTVQRDTLQCAHCGGHWEVKPGSKVQRGFCMKCMAPLCGQAKCMQSCHPVEARLDKAAKEAARAIRLASGLYVPSGTVLP